METNHQNLTDDHVINFLRTRRSVPAKLMGGPGPDDAQLREILQIAARVPDHGKLAPWRFIRYGNEKCVDLGRKLLARARDIAAENGTQLSEDMIEIECNRLLRTPVVVAVISCSKPHPKIPEWEQVLSSGAVAMNMLMAANAHGFDAQWLTEWYAYDETLAGEFGLIDGERIAGIIHMGTRRHPKSERDRPDLDKIFTKMDS